VLGLALDGDDGKGFGRVQFAIMRPAVPMWPQWRHHLCWERKAKRIGSVRTDR
jgi:hypothetical protein